MKKFAIALFLILSGCTNKTGVETNSFNDNIVKNVTKYLIQSPAEMDELAPSFSLAVGSGLIFKEKKADGNLLFYSITDRGPSCPMEKRKIGSEEISGLVCFHPQFTPFIALIEVAPGKSADIIDYIAITKNQQPISGMADKSIIRERPITPNLDPIQNVHFGLDTESVAMDKDGNFWIGDEYGPSLNFADHEGNIIKSYTPGNGLPEIFKHMQANRGFESLDIAPNGKVYAVLEGVLDIEGETKKKALFVRMLELDPTTGKTRMFAYPLSAENSEIIFKTKISDLAAISNNSFLVAEQSTNQEKQINHNIYKLDITNASDISDVKLEGGMNLEHGKLSDLHNIHMIKKELLLNAEKYGWPYEKLEGLAIVDDQTIAFTNDNDFGISNVKINEECDDTQCSIVETIPSDLHKHTYLWIIDLDKPLRA